MKKISLLLITTMLLQVSFANAADIIWVHQMRGGGDGENNPARGGGSLSWEDDAWRQLIEGRGHNIIAHDFYDDFESISIEDFDSQVAEMEAADLVMFSRDSSSGDYNDPLEHEAWTSSFSTPMIVMTPYLLRSNRWDMVQSTSIQDAVNPMVPTVPDHPIFEGVELNADGQIDFWSQLGDNDNIDLVNTTDFGFAQVIAAEARHGHSLDRVLGRRNGGRRFLRRLFHICWRAKAVPFPRVRTMTRIPGVKRTSLQQATRSS